MRSNPEWEAKWAKIAPPGPDLEHSETVYFMKNRPAGNAQQLGQVSLVELLVILILYPQLLREE